MTRRFDDRSGIENALLREMKFVHRASRPSAAFAALGLIGLCSLACSDNMASNTPGGAAAGAGSTGGSANGGAGSGVSGGTSMPADLSKGGPKLRVLTQLEYMNSLTDLLG